MCIAFRKLNIYFEFDASNTWKKRCDLANERQEKIFNALKSGKFHNNFSRLVTDQ